MAGLIPARSFKKNMLMAEGKGFAPLDRVNGRRFSRPLHGFQARPNRTKRDQSRPMVIGIAKDSVLVRTCPDLSGFGSSVYQMCTMSEPQIYPLIADDPQAMKRRQSRTGRSLVVIRASMVACFSKGSND